MQRGYRRNINVLSIANFSILRTLAFIELFGFQ
jgi:hypothetical protein